MSVFPTDVFKTAKEIGLNIGAVDNEKLPEEVKALVGNRPVIELNMMADGKIVEYNNPEVPVTIRIPYTITEEEMKNSDHIVVWYVNGEGKIVPVCNGRYDAASKSVVFTTTHFSKYAIAYVFKTFEDIRDVSWAKESIEAMASKGIIRGESDKAFAPESNIKRADFVMLLIKTLGINANAGSEISDYAVNDIASMVKEGLVKGSGSRVNPMGNTTRAEAAVLLYRIYKK